MCRVRAGHRLPAVLLLFVLLSATLSGEESPPDALAAYRQGRYQEAIRITLDEIDAAPNNTDSYVVLGWSLNALGRHREAIDYGLRALQISQFDSRLLQIVSEAFFGAGDNLQALQYLERYVRIAPTGSYIDWAYYVMGEILIAFGEYHRADIALTTSVYHNGRNAVRWMRLGWAREQLEDRQHALTAYDRALQLDPRNTEAASGRQRVLGR